MGAVILMIIFVTSLELVDFIWTFFENVRKERKRNGTKN